MKKTVGLFLLGCAWGATSLAAGFTPEEARRVYGVVSTNAPASVMEADGFVFMDLKWSVPAEAEEDDREELELTALSDALERYVVAPSRVVTNSPFAAPLTEWLVPEVVYNIPNIPSTVVKVEQGTNFCRKVFAFPAKNLAASRKESASLEDARHAWKDEDWLKGLKKYSETLKTAQDRRQFMVLLGCPVANVVEDGGKGEFGVPVKGAERGLAELDILLKAKEADLPFFAAHGGLLWPSYAAAGTGLFYPCAKPAAGDGFSKALALCKSKDWKAKAPEILELLAESIRANPLDAQKWLYLGGVLRGTDRNMDALVAYVQSARFDSSNKDAWKGIARCCEALGMKTNAAGLGWLIKLRQ